MIFTYEIAFDCQDPARVADFWGSALYYEQQTWSPEEIEAALAAHPEWRDRAVVEDMPARHPRLYLQRVPEAKSGRNRVRFEVGLPEADFAAEAARLVGLGATVLDGSLVADPEGNEFEVVPVEGPPRFTAVVIEALDPRRLADFWRRAFRFVAHGEGCDPPPDWLRIEGGSLVAHGERIAKGFPGDASPADGPVQTLVPGFRFVATGEPKRVKNRIHLDLVCTTSDDYAAERARVFSMGASPEDPASGHEGMFDPEGNEFCLHDPRLDAP